MEKIMKIVNIVSGILTIFSLFSLLIVMGISTFIYFFIWNSTIDLGLVFVAMLLIFFFFTGVFGVSTKWIEAYAS